MPGGISLMEQKCSTNNRKIVIYKIRLNKPVERHDTNNERIDAHILSSYAPIAKRNNTLKLFFSFLIRDGKILTKCNIAHLM